MKKSLAILCLLAGTANAQNFGFTPQQIQFLDLRYWRTTNAFNAGLTTSTVFGALGNVAGTYDTLTYTETDPIFGPWLTSFSATNVPGATYSADTTTVTNDGNGQFSVKNYDTNAIAILTYQINNRHRFIDFAPQGYNERTFAEAASGPLSITFQGASQ